MAVYVWINNNPKSAFSLTTSSEISVCKGSDCVENVRWVQIIPLQHLNSNNFGMMIPPDEFTPSTTTLNLAAFTASTSTKGKLNLPHQCEYIRHSP
jgi:hypothetical protein